jgi:hypothetical protein
MRHKTINEIDIEVFHFVKTYKGNHDGNSPSYEEIVGGTSITSKGAHLSFILEKLAAGGYLSVNGERQIELNGGYYSYDSYYAPTLGEQIT